MMKFAFISRHELTDKQHEMAQEQNVELVAIGDADAFSITPEFVADKGIFDGVVVVHPATAMNLAKRYKIGVFENRLRVEEGMPVIFQEKAFHIFDLTQHSFTPGMV